MVMALGLVAGLTACGGGGDSGNQAPTVSAGADKSVTVNTPVTIVGTASDAEGAIASIEWSEGGAVISTALTFDYTPTVLGAHTLTLTVMDSDGATASDTMVVTATAVVVPPVNTAPTWTASSYASGVTVTDADDTVKVIKDMNGLCTDAENDVITIIQVC